MKNIKKILFFLFIISVSSAMAQQSKLITPQEFKETMEAEKVEFQLLDIRTPKEFNKDHLENAININYYDKDFKAQLNKLGKEKPTYVYCHSAGRSGKSMKLFKDLGFKTVYDMDKGITGWRKAKYPTVK